MTPEEELAAKVAEEERLKAEAEALANDPLKKLQEENAKLTEERDNYKEVALKRLGKLPGDAAFLDKDGNGELSVAEQVRIELLNREIEKNKEAEKAEIERIKKENAELRLAVKNRPGSSTIGNGSGSGPESKDNVFSEVQLTSLRAKAKRLGAEPEAFIQKAKDNLLRKG